MKKPITLLLTALLCLSFAACGKDTADADDTQPQDTEPARQTVALTQDNWQDYFEFRLAIDTKKNAFDEMTDIYCSFKLYLKEDVAGKIEAMDGVALEYQLSDGYGCWYEYDAYAGELTQDEASDTASFDGWVEHNSIQLCLADLRDGRSITPHVPTESVTIEGNKATFVTLAFGHMDIVRISGTLTVAE